MTLKIAPPSETTAGPPGQSGDVVLVADTTMTTDWQDSDELLVKGADRVGFKVKYVKGSETTARVVLQGSADGGTTWWTLTTADAVSSGSREVTKADFKFTPANFDATDYLALPPCDPSGAAIVRARFKYVGGSAPGTIGVRASVVARESR